MPELTKRKKWPPYSRGYCLSGSCRTLGRYLIESSGEPSEVVMTPLLGRSSSSQIWYQQVEDNGISKQAVEKHGFNYTSVLPARVCACVCVHTHVLECVGGWLYSCFVLFQPTAEELNRDSRGRPKSLVLLFGGYQFSKISSTSGRQNREIHTAGYTGKVSTYLRRSRMLFSFRLRVV